MKLPEAIRQALAAVLFALLSLAGGCLPVTATDFDRLYAAKQAYQTSGTLFEAAIDNHFFKTQDEARPVQAARDAARAILSDAQAKLAAGDKLGFNFAMDSFQTALGAFRQYLLRSNVPDPQLQSRSEPWTSFLSSRSLACSNPRYSKSASGVPCSPRRSAANSSRPKSMRHSTPRLLLRTSE